MLEGDGPWRPGGAIAVPAAQMRDDPGGGPGEAVPEMRIFLLLGSALDRRVDSLQGRHLVPGEGQAGRFVAAPVMGLHHLEGERGGLGGAIVASFSRRSALAIWLSSRCNPCVFRMRKSCSMTQRSLYQVTICQAAATLGTAWVVSRRQCSGSTPAGGSRLTISTRVRRTQGGRSRALLRGRLTATVPKRSVRRAVRPGLSGARRGRAIVRVSAAGKRAPVAYNPTPLAR